MQTTWSLGALAGGALLLALAGPTLAQRRDAFVESRDHPAIGYSRKPARNLVADLNDRIQRGSLPLAFDAETGYLRSTLDALHVPIASQSLVFSGTSAQFRLINPGNPRAIYFNDTVAVAWVRGANVLEVAAQDLELGVVFYTLAQTSTARPRFTRDNDCLACHLSWDTLGVPGAMVLTTFPMSDDPNAYASGFVVDHRSPLDQRWGGWYVTGRVGSVEHAGNVPVVVSAAKLAATRGPTPRLASVTGVFNTSGYLTPHSDAVALMVLEHQTRMTNLITRVGWEARIAVGVPVRQASPARLDGAAGAPARLAEAARDMVDYLLFVDEAPLSGRIEGSSRFAVEFAATGPRDRMGRSLRQLDLERRLMRYPCSYMIYTPAFDALPPDALDAVYRRLWHVLSGDARGPVYARLSLADRQAVVEILRETKPVLPAYFHGAVR